MLDKYQIQKLVDLPIEGVATRLGLKVSHHKCLCPFHEDHHASLTFDRRRNRYRCFVCGAHGRTIDLVSNTLRLSFKESTRWLADSSNIIIREDADSPAIINKESMFDASRYSRFFEHPFLNDAARRFIFDCRQLDQRVISWCRITSWCDRQGVNWLQIPYYDINWKLIGIQNRRLGLTQTGAPRFRFPYGSRCSIYNLPVLRMLRTDEPLYITEGCSDCWAMLSSGHKAIAIPSATLLKPADIDLITLPLRNGWGGSFHMYPDQDEPGERLFLQLRELLALSTGRTADSILTRHQLPTGCKDYADYYIQQKKK